MVHRLMEQTGVMDVQAVAKAGDTVRDMQEGTNAGCGQVIGVLSGADSSDALQNAGATTIVRVLPELSWAHIPDYDLAANPSLV